MRWRRWHTSNIIISALLIVVLIIVVTLGFRLLLLRNTQNNSIKPLPPVNPISQKIVQENALSGTTDWVIAPNKGATTQIQAYASATSVAPGDTLTFYVSTQEEGISYVSEIYRLGWYDGTGGRLLTAQANLKGFAQGYYDKPHHHLVNCVSCFIDPQTGLVEARWLPSYSLVIPLNWPTGIYLAKFIDAHAMATYVPFVVRTSAPSYYLVVTPDTTYQAYNYWGGYSLYKEDDTSEVNSAGRAVKVSFDRPYTQVFGSGDLLSYAINSVRWLEHQGYSISYISDVDLHEHPELLLQHRAYISIGHDEYWTKEMRDGVEHALAQGVSLAFFGANASYWQMRFEANSRGILDRIVVCYKVETKNKDLDRDPFYGRDNSRVTAQWRDPVLHRPENALIGIMFSDLTLNQRGYPWQVNPTVKASIIAATGLKPGVQYGCGLVGYEWDRVFTGGQTPKNLQIIGTSPTRDSDGIADISNTTYYEAPSGAMVFASGSIYWASALDNYRLDTDPLCDGKPLVIDEIQKLMMHVMDALINAHHL